MVFELKLGRFEPEYIGKLNFYVQLIDDKMRDHLRDEGTLGLLLVVGRDDVTVEVALRGVSTPLAVSEWRRLAGVGGGHRGRAVAPGPAPAAVLPVVPLDH